MEPLRVPDYGRKRRAGIVLLLSLAGIAATGGLIWSQRFPMSTKHNSVQAATKGTPAEQLLAVIVLRREIRQMIEALQTVADQDGDAAEQARLAIERIREQVR